MIFCVKNSGRQQRAGQKSNRFLLHIQIPMFQTCRFFGPGIQGPSPQSFGGDAEAPLPELLSSVPPPFAFPEIQFTTGYE
ncbi:hypothetical protein, partial [Victivallis lenta]|uniref:hypothetical protein n=1 Tax=Victivallis lenta TaxID=2606640 RepID=UPI003AF21AE7